MDTVGPRKAEGRRGIQWAWSITAKTAFLGGVFVLVPVFLYIEFRSAHETSQELLLRSVRAEGRTISQSLLPLLTNADPSALPEIGRDLARYAGEVTTIKLLLQPAGTQNATEGFYYVASWPPVAPTNLEAERDTLASQGVLDRLSENCRDEMPFSLIYHRPTGGAEIVTAVTPVSTAAGCWAVVASFSEDAFPGAHLGQPYWATPPVIIAAVIYVTMAAITFATLLSVRGGLRHFTLRARRIRERGPDAGSFADRSNLPELADVAAEFDRMVEALYRSAADIRQTAEDNAHAFKTPGNPAMLSFNNAIDAPAATLQGNQFDDSASMVALGARYRFNQWASWYLVGSTLKPPTVLRLWEAQTEFHWSDQVGHGLTERSLAKDIDV